MYLLNPTKHYLIIYLGNKDKNAFDNTIDIPGKTTKIKYLEKNQQRELQCSQQEH